MGVHIIGIIVEGVRGRFEGEFTDEEYYALPFIRIWGCLPEGMLAWHLEDGETVETSERVREIGQLPLAYAGTRRADAREVLLEAEREQAREFERDEGARGGEGRGAVEVQFVQGS